MNSTQRCSISPNAFFKLKKASIWKRRYLWSHPIVSTIPARRMLVFRGRSVWLPCATSKRAKNLTSIMPCAMVRTMTSLIVIAVLRIVAAVSEAQTGRAPTYGKNITVTSCHILRGALKNSKPKYISLLKNFACSVADNQTRIAKLNVKSTQSVFMFNSFALRIYLVALILRLILVLFACGLGIGLADMFQ